MSIFDRIRERSAMRRLPDRGAYRRQALNPAQWAYAAGGPGYVGSSNYLIYPSRSGTGSDEVGFRVNIPSQYIDKFRDFLERRGIISKDPDLPSLVSINAKTALLPGAKPKDAFLFSRNAGLLYKCVDDFNNEMRRNMSEQDLAHPIFVPSRKGRDEFTDASGRTFTGEWVTERSSAYSSLREGSGKTNSMAFKYRSPSRMVGSFGSPLTKDAGVVIKLNAGCRMPASEDRSMTIGGNYAFGYLPKNPDFIIWNYQPLEKDDYEYFNNSFNSCNNVHGLDVGSDIRTSLKDDALWSYALKDSGSIEIHSKKGLSMPCSELMEQVRNNMGVLSIAGYGLMPDSGVINYLNDVLKQSNLDPILQDDVVHTILDGYSDIRRNDYGVYLNTAGDLKDCSLILKDNKNDEVLYEHHFGSRDELELCQDRMMRMTDGQRDIRLADAVMRLNGFGAYGSEGTKNFNDPLCMFFSKDISLGVDPKINSNRNEKSVEQNVSQNKGISI